MVKIEQLIKGLLLATVGAPQIFTDRFGQNDSLMVKMV
jgi:hypothetical protein